jgi:hypothetical protein
MAQSLQHDQAAFIARIFHAETQKQSLTYSIISRQGRSIKKMENCSSIMMGAALADLKFACEQANPQNAKVQRPMWYRRIFSHKFLREIPRN